MNPPVYTFAPRDWSSIASPRMIPRSCSKSSGIVCVLTQVLVS
jgi:hypothetical protein